jgi:hypothetical protein
VLKADQCNPDRKRRGEYNCKYSGTKEPKLPKENPYDYYRPAVSAEAKEVKRGTKSLQDCKLLKWLTNEQLFKGCPKSLHATDIAKHWKTLDEDARRPWLVLQAQDRERYEIERAAYNASGGNVVALAPRTRMSGPGFDVGDEVELCRKTDQGRQLARGIIQVSRLSSKTVITKLTYKGGTHLEIGRDYRFEKSDLRVLQKMQKRAKHLQ